MSNNSNSIPTRLISNYASEMKEQIIDLFFEGYYFEKGNKKLSVFLLIKRRGSE